MRYGWITPRRAKVTPFNHDHVQAMQYRLGVCWCEDCGATWVMSDKGWACVKGGSVAS